VSQSKMDDHARYVAKGWIDESKNIEILNPDKMVNDLYRTLEDPAAPQEDVVLALYDVDKMIINPKCNAARAEFDYWHEVFEEVGKATTREQVKTIMRRSFCRSHEHIIPVSRGVQHVMAAVFYRMWRKLDEIDSVINFDFDAKDVVTPPYLRGKGHYEKIIAEIAAETGETAVEMAARIALENSKKC